MLKDGHRLCLGEAALRSGDDGLREIERAPPGIAHHGRAADDARPPFRDQCRVLRGRAAQYRRRELGAGAHRLDQRLDEPRRGQRRIALQVDDDARREPEDFDRLGAAFGAVAATGRGHHHLGAEPLAMGLDATIVGCDIDRVDPAHRARRAPCPLHERRLEASRPPKRRERLARKAARGIAGGDDEDDLRIGPRGAAGWNGRKAGAGRSAGHETVGTNRGRGRPASNDPISLTERKRRHKNRPANGRGGRRTPPPPVAPHAPRETRWSGRPGPMPEE